MPDTTAIQRVIKTHLLTGEEVVKYADRRLFDKYNPRSIFFGRNQHGAVTSEMEIGEIGIRRVITEVGINGRTRRGLMGYFGATLFEGVGITGTSWVLSPGLLTYGPYAKPYSIDLLAFGYSSEGKEYKQIHDELVELIRNSKYFENSIVVGLSDGRLAVERSGPFAELMTRTGIEGTPRGVNIELLDFGTKPINRQQNDVMFYKPRAVGALIRKIEYVFDQMIPADLTRS